MVDKFNRNFVNNGEQPKGNIGDWQHASKLFLTDNFKHSPKLKFLYHVTFYLTDEAKTVIPELQDYTNEIGMLVKSADLPSYTANVETKHQYNRKKNVQTKIEYNSIDIVFHDDNFGSTSALLEAYFKFYFADGRYDNLVGQSAFGTGETDNPYKSTNLSGFRYGLDSGNVKDFFRKIDITQMARGWYTTYTLVNPIITDWGHSDLEYDDDQGTAENTITVAYESVFYDRGIIQSGGDGNPTGFGRVDHYDQSPSFLSENEGFERTPNITNSFEEPGITIPGQVTGQQQEGLLGTIQGAVDSVDQAADTVGSIVNTASGIAETAEGAIREVTTTVDNVGGLVGVDFPTGEINEAAESVSSGIRGAQQTVNTVRGKTAQASTAVTSTGEAINSFSQGSKRIADDSESLGETISGFSSSAGTLVSGSKNAVSDAISGASDVASSISNSVGEAVGSTVSGLDNNLSQDGFDQINPKVIEDSAFESVKKDIQLAEGLNDINSIRDTFDRTIGDIDTAQETPGSLAEKVKSRFS